MSDSSIVIKGAREHNLRDVDVEIPRDRLVVITGLSGSGKSSLAFDTIYAEGQRRYVESLSSYARQFLGQMDKPDLDSIDGLSPAVSIDQKTTSKNPRSTVGTVTEIYDYLRLLYARIGVPHCPECGREIERQTTDQVADKMSPRSTITCACSTRASACPIARSAAVRSSARRPTRLPTRFSPPVRVVEPSCSRRWCRGARASSSSCWTTSAPRASRACA